MKNKLSTIYKAIIGDTPIIIVFLLLFICSIIFVPGFGSAYNLKNYLVNSAPLLIVASGVTFIVLNGGIDFSATSVLTLGSVVGAYILVKSSLADTFFAIPAAILIVILIGIVIGMFNGYAVAKLKMPSFIATLATMMIIKGVAVWFASVAFETASLSGLPDAFLVIGGGNGQFMVPIIIALVIVIFTHWLLTYTKFGREVYSVGVNPKTSFVSGISVSKTIITMCTLSGLYAGLASIMYTAKNQAGIPTLGDKLFIDIIGGIIIGGTSIAGGFGGVKKTFFGILFIMLIDNALNLMGVTWYVITLIKGIMVILAAFIDIMTRNASKKRVIVKTKVEVGV